MYTTTIYSSDWFDMWKLIWFFSGFFVMYYLSNVLLTYAESDTKTI